MVGELHIRNFEAIHFDLVAVQNEIKLFAGAAARVGRQAVQIGAGQSRRLREQVELVVAPVGVEVAGDDDGLMSLADAGISTTGAPEKSPHRRVPIR